MTVSKPATSLTEKDVKNFSKYDEYTKEVPKFGHRHIQIILLFAVLTFSYTTRMSLYVAIVAMTDNSTSSNPNIPTFDWTNTNVIISALSWSYTAPQVLGAYFLKKHGTKWFFLAAITLNGLTFTSLPQIALHFGSTGMIVGRIIQGFCQSIFLPTAHTILGNWVPETERATLSIFALSGGTCGTILGELGGGYIAASDVGWPAIFYGFGSFAVVSSLFWFFFAHNSPATHPTISPKERQYIESSLRVSQDNQNAPVPWKGILTSLPFYAILISHIGAIWSSQTLSSETPTYLSKIWKYDIKSNGFISAGPQIVSWICSLSFAFVADCLIANKYMSTINVRRTFQILGVTPAVTCLLVISFLQKGQNNLCVILLFLNSFFQSASSCGSGINHLDLSSRYSGIIQAFTNSISSTVAIFAPLYVQWMVPDMTNAMQWRKVFITASTVHFLATIFFVIFLSAERQSWDGEENQKSTSSSRNRKISSISVLEAQYN